VSSDDAGLTPEEVAVQRLGYVRDAAGDRFPDLDLESSPYFTAITDRPEEPLARLGGWFDLGTEALRSHPNVLVGSEGEIVEQLLHRRDVFGVNYVTIPESEIDGFAPIAARLTGT
jgi:hypothetical protein